MFFPSRNFFQIVVGALIGSMIILALQYTVPVIAFPVARDWDVRGNIITAEISAYKVRDCQIVSGASTGYIVKNNVVYEVDFKALSAAPSSKPASLMRISFSPWQWTNNRVKIDIDDHIEVMTVVNHKCGDRIVSTTVGPFIVPQGLIKRADILDRMTKEPPFSKP